ncbi:MAG: class II aldolase/adducin family protein [Candidatus Komeilibacteria bacterium]|nr:class II aldolase/adducin family protein [Candidatus Komeilibacteria bacterium]
MSKEGVIKFQNLHSQENAINTSQITPLSQYRDKLKKLKLIGGGTKRYHGLGFGNVSRRTIGDQFIITGSQTGALEKLAAKDYALVTKFSIGQNKLWSQGLTNASSESMTHAALYQISTKIKSVFHVHFPELWEKKDELPIPQTPGNVAYGTPAMAKAIQKAYLKAGKPIKGVIIMGGHEDGVIAFGPTPQETFQQLTKYL